VIPTVGWVVEARAWVAIATECLCGLSLFVPLGRWRGSPVIYRAAPPSPSGGDRPVKWGVVTEHAWVVWGDSPVRFLDRAVKGLGVCSVKGCVW
jgi:hypothetical protein